ncbi:probable galactinol--sucrose galactosyltransferase 6 isoform X2, partial [Tanacetum coccineum]
IDELEYLDKKYYSLAIVSMKVKGRGRFGMYSTAKPRRCMVGPNEVEFVYDSDSGLLTLDLRHMPEDGNCHDIMIHL